MGRVIFRRLNIGLGSNLFATWVGFLVPFGKPIALVVGSRRDAEKARLELARIGYDNVLGYIEADISRGPGSYRSWASRNCTSRLETVGAPGSWMCALLGEWDAGHIEGADPHTLACLAAAQRDASEGLAPGDHLREWVSELDRGEPAAGQGFSRVQNVMGGMGAYFETGFRNGSRRTWCSWVRIFNPESFGVNFVFARLS